MSRHLVVAENSLYCAVSEDCSY